MMLTRLTIPVLAALALPVAAPAQTIIDATALRDIEEIDIVTADGEDLGEVENVLVDATGTPVAVSVEVGGFLGVGDDDRIIPMDRLTYQDGNYLITITREEVETLPEWED